MLSWKKLNEKFLLKFIKKKKKSFQRFFSNPRYFYKTSHENFSRSYYPKRIIKQMPFSESHHEISQKRQIY